MVGVSVCHHVRVGIKRRKAALLELCGLLQARAAGNRTTLLLKEEEELVSSSHKKSSFFQRKPTLASPSAALVLVTHMKFSSGLNSCKIEHTGYPSRISDYFMEEPFQILLLKLTLTNLNPQAIIGKLQ
ncbi:uncharacterized protein LOC143688710 [Tamandua tetradactyla]|uniref:uncharacterized protein LOC143688710 n=1 Tax=Tamandua tetradactyla TaxID=48850 RepID=UPI004053A12E